MYRCKKISQQEADRWLKEIFDLHGDTLFEPVFCSEYDKKIRRDDIWALPSKERTYYVASSDNVPVLFVGANWGNPNNTVTVASVAKVTNDRQFSGAGVDCMKALAEEWLIPECKKRNKSIINAMASTIKGQNFFRRFSDNLPTGLEIDHPEYHGVGGNFIYRIK